MTEDYRDKSKELSEMQQREATLHWTRNGFFLLSSSIMLLALSQFEGTSLMLAFGFIGTMLNIIWLMIQHRSSEYIKNWKNQVKELEKDKTTNTYSEKVGGYEMRKLSLLLPFPFIIIWSVIMVQSVLEYVYILFPASD